MKKDLLLLVLIVLVTIRMCLLAGCRKSEENIAKEKQEQLITAIKERNHDAIKMLFASNKIVDIKNFNDSIDELLICFEGKYVSHVAGGPMVVTSKDNGNILKY